MKLLLDTHSYVWWASNPARLSRTVFAACHDPTNELLLSVASVWEMMIKQGIGKLRLRHDMRTMVQRDLSRNRLTLLQVLPDHLWELSALPSHHRDPFDRMLVAQSRIEDLTLVSADPEIAKYDVKRLW